MRSSPGSCRDRRGRSAEASGPRRRRRRTVVDPGRPRGLRGRRGAARSHFPRGAGEIVALLGANGAGKTTTLRAISGLLPPTAGGGRLDGESLAGVPAHDIVARGLVQVPEGRRLFATLTVRENLELGAFTRTDASGIEESLRLAHRAYVLVTGTVALEGAAKDLLDDPAVRRAYLGG